MANNAITVPSPITSRDYVLEAPDGTDQTTTTNQSVATINHAGFQINYDMYAGLGLIVLLILLLAIWLSRRRK